MRYRIEVNLARRGASPTWHYLMDDEYSACEFDNESEARALIAEENRGADIRLVEFTPSGIGRPKP